MRITDIRAVQPDAPDAPPDWRTSMGQILVAVDTDAGVTGYGVGGGGAAGIHVIHTVINDVLHGEDATDISALWHRMYRATLPFGRKGLAIMALSGVDLALWDLWGRAEGRPVCELLGGTDGPRDVPIYRTLFVQDGRDLTERLHDDGAGVKLHFSGTAGRRVSEVVDAVHAVRDVIGPDRPLMIDAFMRWGERFTLEAAERIAGWNIDWIEEPLSPDDLAGFRLLRDRCPIPIAGGEHEFTSLAFERLMEERLLTVVQPDVTWCGGLTELVQIYETAQAHGIRVCPHRGAEPWGLHAIATLDACALAESGRPWLRWVRGMPQPTDGRVALPMGPGFGVDYPDVNFG